MARKKGLGRGLDALLAGSAAKRSAEAAEISIDPETPVNQPSTTGSGDGELRHLPVEFLQRGRYQPRRDMDQAALQELADSIKAQGLMQPIVVRPLLERDRYEIIAGERRWRAAQLAGLDTVPVLVRDVPDEAAIAMALIENIQREDLNAMEEAIALSRLQQEFELTHQQIAEAVGKSRSAVTNLLRLISLRDEVQRLLENGDIELGHAKAILGLPKEQQAQIAETVVGKALSVRQTEALVRRTLEEQQPGAQEKAQPDADILKLEEEIAERVGSPVKIQHGSKGKGKLVISYSSLDELDGILGHIK